MFAIVALGLVAGLFWGLKSKAIKNPQMIVGCMIALYVFSISPSIVVPYIVDDEDHLFTLATAIGEGKVTQWLFTPHNEHVIPLLKWIYLYNYQNFGLDPTLFHVIIFAVCAGILCFTYALIRRLTQSDLAGLLGVGILSCTFLFDESVFVMADAHILVCLLFFLMMFYALDRNARTPSARWRLMIFFSVLLVPSTFALGVTAVIFFFLYNWLCVHEDFRAPNNRMIPLVLAAATISFIPYIYHLSDIIHTSHYNNYQGHTTLWDTLNIPLALNSVFKVFYQNVIPGLNPNPYIAFGLFFLALITVTKRFNEIPFRKIFFFLIFGAFINLIIYSLRADWGQFVLVYPRYFTFPCVMMTFIYALVLTVFFRHAGEHFGCREKIDDSAHAMDTKTEGTGNDFAQRKNLLVIILCVSAVAYFSQVRYNGAQEFADQKVIMQQFYTNLKVVFVKYFEKHPQERLTLRDGRTFLPIPSRYALRPVQFYAKYVLPQEINDKISWGKTSDPRFIQFLKDNGYGFLMRSFQDENE